MVCVCVAVVLLVFFFPQNNLEYGENCLIFSVTLVFTSHKPNFVVVKLISFNCSILRVLVWRKVAANCCVWSMES